MRSRASGLRIAGVEVMNNDGVFGFWRTGLCVLGKCGGRKGDRVPHFHSMRRTSAFPAVEE